MKHHTFHSFEELSEMQSSRTHMRIMRATKIEIESTTETSNKVPHSRNLAKEEYYTRKRAIKLYLDENNRWTYEYNNWTFEDYKVFCVLNENHYNPYRWISINEARELCSRWNTPMAKHYLFK